MLLPFILSIESSTKNCSVCLSKGEEIIGFKEESGSYAHAEKLSLFAEEVLQKAEIKFSDLQAVAVSQGPGSYTGLRIGVSLAKGLSFALQIPLIAVSALQAMATNKEVVNEAKAISEQCHILPMLDARRMEVYAAVLDTKGKYIEEVKAVVIDEQSFSSYKFPLLLIGEGAEKTKEILQGNKLIHYSNKDIQASALDFAPLAYKAFLQKDFVNLAYFEPLYLKDFLAVKSKKKLFSN
jgi:tRNA threonylcarbamoyladenosine biosynthesis protein TsaB